MLWKGHPKQSVGNTELANKALVTLKHTWSPEQEPKCERWGLDAILQRNSKTNCNRRRISMVGFLILHGKKIYCLVQKEDDRQYLQNVDGI